MRSSETLATLTYPTSLVSESDEEITDMDVSINTVEKILNYKFKNRKLLEDALTHSSCTNTVSYERLEFVGDAVIGLAISSHVFLAYPKLDPGQLSLLRAANVSTEKLARVAVRHDLYKYVRHKAVVLDEKVKEFVLVVQQEEQAEFHGGAMKAPKVLADIVESVAAAVYVDCGFDLKEFWVKFRGILEPIITMELLEQQPQPVTMLFELCQKEGKHVNIKHWRKGEKDIASVYVDGEFIVSASSEHKENAKLLAAKAALEKFVPTINAAKAALEKFVPTINSKMDIEVERNSEIEGAKQKLHELCGRKKWHAPVYRVEKQTGPPHDRIFKHTVEVETAEAVVIVSGEEKSRTRDAENSAASAMIWALRDSKLI